MREPNLSHATLLRVGRETETASRRRLGLGSPVLRYSSLPESGDLLGSIYIGGRASACGDTETACAGSGTRYSDGAEEELRVSDRTGFEDDNPGVQRQVSFGCRN